METYLLRSWNQIGDIQFYEGDEFTFDGSYVTFTRGHRFLGFISAKGIFMCMQTKRAVTIFA